jgi:hypothetical protein
MIATVRAVDSRDECRWSHACSLKANMRGIQWYPRVQNPLRKRAPYRTLAVTSAPPCNNWPQCMKTSPTRSGCTTIPNEISSVPPPSKVAGSDNRMEKEKV